MSLKSRLRKIEKQMNVRTPEEDAMAYLQLGVQLGALKEEVITEEAVKGCVAEGLMLSKVLEKIDGATRGLPKKRADAKQGLGLC
jgi:hypothetical protein